MIHSQHKNISPSIGHTLCLWFKCGASVIKKKKIVPLLATNFDNFLPLDSFPVCPRSSAPFYKVTYYTNWATTS